MHSIRDKPAIMEIRVVGRDGRRVLQQYRQKPGGQAYQYEWVDVALMPRASSVIRFIRSDAS